MVKRNLEDSASDAPPSRRAITVDYRRSVEKNVTQQHCYENGGHLTYWTPTNPDYYYGHYDPSWPGTCLRVSHTLKQVEVGASVAALRAAGPIAVLYLGLWDGAHTLAAALADSGWQPAVLMMPVAFISYSMRPS